MDSHHCSSGSSEEVVALYASGALTPGERAGFETHLASGCASCRNELERLSTVISALVSAAPAVTPNPRTRETLMERIIASITAPASPLRRHFTEMPIATSGLFTLRASDNDWQPSDVPGVSLRVLYVDEPSNQFTALVKMVAGAAYPRHVHGGPEQCLVLEGDLRVGNDVLRSGDYQRAEPGSVHGVQSTEHGCLLLITSSLSDSFS